MWLLISSSSLEVIARPSPVPPNRRVIDESTCVKGVNSLDSLSPGIPSPESFTEKVISDVLVALSFLFNLTSMWIPPSSVNLMAFPTKLTRICLTRVTSPYTLCFILS